MKKTSSHPKATLTKARITRLPIPEKNRAIYYDDRVQGFGVRVTPNGAMTYVLVRRIGKSARTLTLGKVSEITLDAARKLATQRNGEIAAGANPMADKQAARAEMTLRELFGQYLERHAKERKRTWKDDEANFDLHLAPLANRQLSSIKSQDVYKLHANIGKKSGKYVANRVLALLSTMYNKASVWGYEGGNPTRGIERFPEKKRDRYIEPHERKAFFEALAKEENTAIRDYVLISLLTGARKANVLSMRWDELNLERKRWVIPAEKSKNTDPMKIPIVSEAKRILEERLAESDSPWVFPGSGATGHLAEPRKGWERILKRAGLKDLRLHDLRRTLGSAQAAAGASLTVIGKSLGHKSIATTAVYARLGDDPVADSMEEAANILLTDGGVKQAAEVVEMKRGGKR